MIIPKQVPVTVMVTGCNNCPFNNYSCMDTYYCSEAEDDYGGMYRENSKKLSASCPLAKRLNKS